MKVNRVCVAVLRGWHGLCASGRSAAKKNRYGPVNNLNDHCFYVLALLTGANRKTQNADSEPPK